MCLRRLCISFVQTNVSYILVLQAMQPWFGFESSEDQNLSHETMEECERSDDIDSGPLVVFAQPSTARANKLARGFLVITRQPL